MIRVPVSKRALVIGGGVAGISAALDLAEQNIPVTLVEKEPTIGGSWHNSTRPFQRWTVVYEFLPQDG